MRTGHLKTGGRYPVLRTVGILYLIAAAVAVIAGVIAAVWALLDAPDTWTGRLYIALGILAATFFATITFLAIAEIIKLFIDVEHNTRMMGGSTTVATTGPTVVATGSSEGKPEGGRMRERDEETAESALLRGH